MDIKNSQNTKLNSNLNSMKISYGTNSIVSGTTTKSISANTETVLGTITIPSQCYAIITIKANNRSNSPNITFGICASQNSTSIQWNSKQVEVPQFRSISNTFMYYNNETSSKTIYLYCTSNLDIILMYITADYVCIPIPN